MSHGISSWALGTGPCLHSGPPLPAAPRPPGLYLLGLPLPRLHSRESLGCWRVGGVPCSWAGAPVGVEEPAGQQLLLPPARGGALRPCVGRRTRSSSCWSPLPSCSSLPWAGLAQGQPLLPGREAKPLHRAACRPLPCAWSPWRPVRSPCSREDTVEGRRAAVPQPWSVPGPCSGGGSLAWMPAGHTCRQRVTGHPPRPQARRQVRRTQTRPRLLCGGRGASRGGPFPLWALSSPRDNREFRPQASGGTMEPLKALPPHCAWW